MVFCLLLLQFVLTVQAIKHNFEHRTEIENKVGISFALEQTEVDDNADDDVDVDHDDHDDSGKADNAQRARSKIPGFQP